MGTDVMTHPGTLTWFAQHESRLAWRDWIAMITAGRRERMRTVAIAIVAFAIFMHFVAYSMVGRYAQAVADKQTLVIVTGCALLSLALMVSQAMESVTRAFYSRSDLDLILASPVAARKVFAVRITTMALSVTMMAILLAAPFINVLAFEGGVRWLGAYGVVAAMGAAATAFAVALTVALFRSIGPKRTRLIAQIVAAVIGAASSSACRSGRSCRTARCRASISCESDAVLARAPDADSFLWLPARAILGDPQALAIVLAVSLRAARRRHRGVLGAVRRPRHRGRGRRRHACAPSALAERIPPRLAQGSAAAEGMDAAAPRPVAHIADADADALSHPACPSAVAELRRRHRRVSCWCPFWSWRQASLPAASRGSRSRARTRPISSLLRRCRGAGSCAPRSRP